MADNFKCWFCKNEIESKEDIELYKVKSTNRKFHKGLNCKDKFLKQIEDKNKEEQKSKEEYIEWDKLYKYVRKEILGYNDGMALSNHQRNKLRSLRNGDLVKRNNKMDNKGYPYDIILMTFKVKRQEIINNIKGKTFEDEKHKFNYIMIIISNSINDVYKRYLHKIKEETMIEENIVNVVVDNTDNKESYKINMSKQKTTNKVANLLSDLF